MTRHRIWGACACLAFWTACAVLLTGCETIGPAPVPKVEIQKEVVTTKRSCVPPGLGSTPTWVATKEKLRAAVGMEDRYQLLSAFFFQAMARLGETEPVIKGCR